MLLRCLIIIIAVSEGYFLALDARDGKPSWMVNGTQYVAFAAGSPLFVYGLK